MSTVPVETKVKAAAVGGGVAVTVAGVVVWMLQTYVFHGSPVPPALQDLIELLISLGLTVAGTFWAGWTAPHTLRPDLERTISS